jgi:ribosomal protein S18 acetylase RimI-like enzyme
MREHPQLQQRPLRIIVGPARHTDLSALAEMQAAAEAAEQLFSPDLGTRLPDRRHARRCFKRTLCSATQRTLVARAGDRLVGMIGIDLHRLSYRHYVVRRYAYVHSLFVEPALRGRGVARRLVKHGLAWARRRGAQQVRLEMAHANRAARGLYESFGFAPREAMFTLDLGRAR